MNLMTAGLTVITVEVTIAAVGGAITDNGNVPTWAAMTLLALLILGCVLFIIGIKQDKRR